MIISVFGWLDVVCNNTLQCSLFSFFFRWFYYHFAGVSRDFDELGECWMCYWNIASVVRSTLMGSKPHVAVFAPRMLKFAVVNLFFGVVRIQPTVLHTNPISINRFCMCCFYFSKSPCFIFYAFYYFFFFIKLRLASGRFFKM